MEPFGIGMAGLGVAGLSTLGAFGLAFRQRRRRQAVVPATRAPRSAADRLEALAAAQAELALRLDALAVQATAPEERLQAMAGQLLGLIRDKNATLETALAGLDQLRARMRALEQMGEPAEARALLETLGQRLDGLQAAQTASAAGLEARLAALVPEGAGLADRLAGVEEKRAAGAEALLGRLTPLETRLAALESGREAERAAGREALKRLEARLEALGTEQGAARADLATLKAEAAGPVRALGEQLTRVLAQKEALAESLLARIAALEAELAARDQGPALDRLADRLEALRAERAATEAGLAGRLAALEGAENPFAAISDQLTALYAQKDATVETVFARLAPLEARLAELDPGAALDRFAERLEAVQGRVAMLEGVENPFAAISGQLTALYAQKDATVETVFARLAPLEARLAELDPGAALDRFAERLEAVQGRVAMLEGVENPFAEISGQLTALYAQKDATVETVFARLAPLEARLAELDPGAALDRFAERLEAVQGRVAAIEGAENPFAAISDQLTALYAQKDATVEAVLTRLAPLEAQLALLAPLAEDDPRAALDGLRARLEALHWAQGETAAGLAALGAAAGEREAEGGVLSDIADRLTRLFAQKDAGIAALLARLTPLEARLAAIEARPWDPPAEAARAEALFADRIAELEASLPRLTAAPQPGSPARAVPSPTPAELEAIWSLPRIVSLHQK